MKQTNRSHSKLIIFLAKVRNILEENLSNENFSIIHLCQELGYSRMQIHRNIKIATGLSTAFYIRQIRMEKACELFLTDTKKTVQEVAFAVGYKDASYFVKIFSTIFGETPKRWQKMMQVSNADLVVL